MVREELQKLRTNGTWFLDSCASRHLYNDRRLFSNLKVKSIDFVMAIGQVIQIKEINNVSILLTDNNYIELKNVILAPGYDSNLILLGQFQETGIIYHDNPIAMTLIQQRKVITHAKRTRNLFILNLAQPGRVMVTMTIQPRVMATAGQTQTMAIIGRGQPIYLVSQDKRICLWYQRLAHINNACVVRTFKLVDGIILEQDDGEYNPAEVFIDSNDSDVSD